MMNGNNVCKDQTGQGMNVYEQINRQNTETVEYDSIKVSHSGDKSDHPKTVLLTQKVLLCGVILNMVILVSFLTVGSIIVMELSNKVSMLSQQLEASVVTVHTPAVKQNSTSKTGHRVAFTATHANGSAPIIFTRSIYNEGGAYDNRNGIFTCQVPGFYYFAYTLSKQFGDDIDFLLCHICVNRVNMVGTMHDPYDSNSDNNGYSMSLSGTFHLEADDIVFVHCDTKTGFSAFISYLCSFTGFLVTADD